jgi:hypothetical protein
MGKLLISVAVLAALCAGFTPLHPVTGSRPEAGMACAQHAAETATWKSGAPSPPIYVNRTLVPLTWNLQESCPLADPTWEWVCCSKAQYECMALQSRLMNTAISQCEACQIALKNLMCYINCSPYQSRFVEPDPIATLANFLVVSSRVDLSPELTDRVWMACKGAVLGFQEMQKMFGAAGVLGLLGMFTSNSPPGIDREGRERNLLNLTISASTSALGDACRTQNNEYACAMQANGTSSKKHKGYPLPRAAVRGFAVHNIVAISMAALLIGAGCIALFNALADARTEAEALRQLEETIADNDEAAYSLAKGDTDSDESTGSTDSNPGISS